MQNFFANYEMIKLGITHVHWINIIIITVMLIMCSLTLRRGDVTQPLDKRQTDQLKGIAILLVVIGHLWIHVSAERCNLIFDESVALFFVLSGFGLTASRGGRELRLKQYIAQRIKRVMVPYWAATVLILFLDFLILHKAYPIEDVILTALGINISSSTRHIDYARWYITLLLFWYAVFPVMILFMRGAKGMMYAAVFAAALVLADHYVVHFDWYQIMAFPLGCLLGIHHETVKRLFVNNAGILLHFSLLVLVILCAYKIIRDPYVVTSFPSIAVRFIDEAESILFSAALIIVVASLGYRGYYSTFLLFAGSVSYELFLLHGVFLIKYNPIISGTTMFPLVLQFLLFLALVLMIAFLFQKGIKVISKPLGYFDDAKDYKSNNKMYGT